MVDDGDVDKAILGGSTGVGGRKSRFTKRYT